MATMLGGQPVFVDVWDDLPQAGGQKLGPVGPWAKLDETTRTDGDDRVEGMIRSNAVGASNLTPGAVMQIATPEGAVAEWIIQTVSDELRSDMLTVTAGPARIWLSERVLVRVGTDSTLSGAGLVSVVLAALVATDEWPAWAIPGTISRDSTISYNWAQANGLAAALSIASAADAAEDAVLADDTVRFDFRRVSASQYALDFLTTAVSGSPSIVQGKNLTSLAIRTDRGLQATALYPVNAGGATIEEAMFAVRTVATNTFDMRDWAYRDDFLGVAFDGQWVGWYAVAPDGSTSIIVNSYAATQQIEVANAAAWGTGNNATVRISPVSGGTPTLAVVDTDAVGRRNLVLSGGAWSSKINWIPNSRWDQWTSSTVVKDWATTGGMTINRLGTAGNYETGTYGLEVVTGATVGACTVSEILMPDDLVSPGGGTQTWRVGIRYKRTVNTGASVALERSVNSGASWSNVASLGSSAAFATLDATFTTNAATLPNRPRLRISSTAVAGSKYVIDRVWMFRDAVEDDDDTYIGNGPSVGFYTGQRALLRARTDGRTYSLGVADRTRDNPAGFPDDALAAGMTARVVSHSRSLDVQQQIVERKRNLLRLLDTTLQVGALRRRFRTIAGS